MNRHVSNGSSVNSDWPPWLVAVSLLSAVVFWALVQIPDVAGAAEMEVAFLKLGSIKGMAQTKGFESQIVVQNMSYGIQQAGQWESANQLSGRITSFSDMKIVKGMDTSSPSLALACANKEQFPSAVISLVSGGQVYLRVTLEGVIVSSVSVGFQAGEARPAETITLKYMKATWEWGTARAGYDLGTNRKM